MNKPIRVKHPLVSIINNALIDLPTPINISSWWNFGSLLGLCLIVQIVTGLFLAMHYTADISLAFSSVNHICRDVNYENHTLSSFWKEKKMLCSPLFFQPNEMPDKKDCLDSANYACKCSYYF